MTAACHLCHGRERRSIQCLTGRDLQALWRVSGFPLSDRAMEPVGPDTRVELYECAGCGFRFYDPSLGGTGTFYEELMQGQYYVAGRAEFDFALRFARERGLLTVLDIGGGDGLFLDQARQAGMTTYGVELNAQAAEAAEAKGHVMVARPVADVRPVEVGGGVDLVTLFQVLEHVPDPVEFVKQAARLARPGGFVLVAVPNEGRVFGMLPYDPANWPPHHLTRWRLLDFQRLAAVTGLRLLVSGADPLYGRLIVNFAVRHNLLVQELNRPEARFPEGLVRGLAFLYRKLGLKYLVRNRGLSIYACLECPTS